MTVEKVAWRGEAISGLILGAAQLGSPYGVANRRGMPSQATALGIVGKAWEGGIDTFDTAYAYGDGESERVLGRALRDLAVTQKARVISKLPPGAHGLDASLIRRHVEAALERIGCTRLWALLLHGADMAALDAGPFVEALEGLKRKGLCRYTGISLYDPPEIERALAVPWVDVVQIPFHVLDSRPVDRDYFGLARRRDKLLLLRSCFLQGLLGMMPEELPPRMAFAARSLADYRAACREARLHPLEAALGFVRQMGAGFPIILGAECPEQIEEGIRLFEVTAGLGLPFERFSQVARSADPRTADPRRWSEATP